MLGVKLFIRWIGMEYENFRCPQCDYQTKLIDDLKHDCEDYNKIKNQQTGEKTMSDLEINEELLQD